MNAAIDNATPDADAKLVAMARAEMYAGLSRLLASPEQAIATAWVDHVMIIERLLMADEALSVDNVLLRIRLDGCRAMANARPADAVDPNDPAAYKPKTEFDNTPWRFNMTQNGKRMTADEFDAWLKSRGVRVVGRKDAAPATTAPDPAAPAPAAEKPKQ